MSRFIITIILLFYFNLSQGQTFLDSYTRYALNKIDNDTLHKGGTRRKRKKYFISQMKMFDQAFTYYKKRKGIDLNKADTLNLIIKTGVETALRSVIIWNLTDTLSFSEDWITSRSNKNVKVIHYNLSETIKQSELIFIRENDSLINLVSKRDYATASKLANDNPVFDGASTTVIVAERNGKKHQIYTLFLRPFAMPPGLYRNNYR